MKNMMTNALYGGKQNLMKFGRVASVLLLAFLLFAVNIVAIAQNGKSSLKRKSPQKRAQVAKSKVVKSVGAQKPAKAVSSGQKAAVPMKAPIENPAVVLVKDTVASTEVKADKVATDVERNMAINDGYRFAAGLRLFWGIGITGKYFLKPQHAVEGILRIRSYREIGTDIGLAGIYQYHRALVGVDGLNWYAGGGAFAGYFSFSKGIGRSTGYNNEGYFGLLGNIGLEYRLKDLPLAISADWQPSLTIVDFYGGSGLGAENGGLGIKYTF